MCAVIDNNGPLSLRDDIAHHDMQLSFDCDMFFCSIIIPATTVCTLQLLLLLAAVQQRISYEKFLLDDHLYMIAINIIKFFSLCSVFIFRMPFGNFFKE